MNYKLICIDLDGTLLDSNRRINQKNIEVLQKAHKLGAHIVVSTGRLYSDAEHFSNLLGVDSPIIASNGGVIRAEGDRAHIYESTFGETLVKDILKEVAFYKQKLSIYTTDTMYFGSFKVYSKVFIERLLNNGIRTTKLRYIFSNKQYKKLLEKEKNQIIKCEVFDYNLPRIKKIKEALMKMPEIEAVSSVDYCVEITPKGVSKGRAVELLAKHYNIDRASIMAIGDSENDLTMIEFAQMGIAMGNASNLLKEKADYITDTNDEHGVAKAVEQIVLMHKGA